MRRHAGRRGTYIDRRKVFDAVAGSVGMADGSWT